MASTTGARSRKRTAKQAIQKDRGDIAAIQQERGRRTKQFQTEVGSYRGATNMAIGQVQRSNLGGLRGTPEGRDLQKEYSGRVKALRQSLPFTLAPVQREYKSDIQGFNTDLSQAQLGLQQDQQDKLAAINDIIAAQKDEAAKAAADIAENKAAKKADVKVAIDVGLSMIQEQKLVNEGKIEGGTKRPFAYPTTDAQWFEFQQALEGKSEVDRRSATKAVKALRRNISRATGKATPAEKARGNRGGMGPFQQRG